MRSLIYRRRRGAAMAELAAALSIILPISIVAGFAAFQVAQAYMIKTTLDLAAQSAARQLAIAYGQDPVSAKAFPEKVFDNVRHLGVVVSTDQFYIPDGVQGWNTDASPPTVRVQIVFQGDHYGLGPFPRPDPLGLGSSITLTGTGVSTLE
ncbi:MAG: pilus assembly protein [Cyanobacteria bacterium HKST-UBA02]|nr:pilus assembly protein [Cyanobacteria bacterium HKST-UBA02]